MRVAFLDDGDFAAIRVHIHVPRFERR